MVSCKNCASQNSLDSKFCRRCGTALVTEDVDIARTKLNALVEEGNAAYNAGRIEEALEVSETALLSDPSSVTALALKMNCLERKERLAEALECAEKIVELNPDSELDKIKRNQLRRQLELTARENAPEGRSWAILAGASACILMLAVGSFGALAMRKSQERSLQANLVKPKPETTVSPNQNSPAPTNPNPVSTNPNPSSNGNPSSSGVTPPQPAQSQNNIIPSTSSRRETEGRMQFPPKEESGTLPNPLEGNISVRPLPVGPPTTNSNTGTANNGTTTPSNPPKRNQPTDTAMDPKPVNNGVTEETKPTGTIELTIRSGNPATSNGGQKVGDSPVNDGNGVQALLKTASQNFQTGNFSTAAAGYERALQNGADPVAYCERLGQTYERMNRKTDATNAYNRGLKACESAIQSGKGDKEKLERLADRYRTHLRLTAGQ